MTWRDRGSTILRGVSSTAAKAANVNVNANANDTNTNTANNMNMNTDNHHVANSNSNSNSSRRSQPTARASNAARRVSTYPSSSASAALLQLQPVGEASSSQLLTTSPPAVQNTPRKREDRYPGGVSVGSKNRGGAGAGGHETVSSRASRASNQSVSYSPPRLTPAAAQKAAAAAAAVSKSSLSSSREEEDSQDSSQHAHEDDDHDDATSHYDDEDEEEEDDTSSHQPQQQQQQVAIDAKLEWGVRRQKVALEKRKMLHHNANNANGRNNTMAGESAAVYHLAHYNDNHPPPHQHAKRRAATIENNVKKPTPIHRNNNNMNDNNSTATNNSKWYQKRLPLVMSASNDSLSSNNDDDDDDDKRERRRRRRMVSLSSTSADDVLSNSSTIDRGDDNDNRGMYLEGVFSDADDDYLKTKQSTAVLSIGLSCIQLLILCLQLTMCGIASLDINPFVGPFPDAFVEWGGKNAYLMLVQQEWWRLVTPSLLHVGILHLLANAFCQLEPIALFEREWGSFRWLVLYIISSVGCVSASSLYDPNTIAVGSSGALMGLFSAKLAQVMSHAMFEVNKANQDEIIRLDQLSSVIIGLILVSLLSFFTYIDWSGHMGGLAAGFFSGMILFCNPIKSGCIKIIWAMLGLAGLISGFGYVFYFLLNETDPDEELGNACEYFRSLFPEGYECGCLW